MYAIDKSRLLKIIALDVTQSPPTQDTFQPIPGGPHQPYWGYQEIGLQSITVMPLGSFPLGPQLQDKIWEWPGDEASIQIQKGILANMTLRRLRTRHIGIFNFIVASVRKLAGLLVTVLPTLPDFATTRTCGCRLRKLSCESQWFSG